MTTLQEKAELLMRLHQSGEGLLLPNAWDVGSARVFEEAGFPVVATTSAGIAFAQGYPDGQQISRAEMLKVVAKIVVAVQVPVTADIEAGYGPTPADVAQTIRGVIEAGAVGVNLEDNTGESSGAVLYGLEEQNGRIKAARDAAIQGGLDELVINARVDTYLFQVGEKASRLEETIRRARAYLEAGASTIFVPGVIDQPTIEILVREIPAPLNLLLRPNSLSIPELFKLGVRRISIGSSVMLATMGLTRDIARELRAQGTYTQLAMHPYSYAEASKLFQKE